MGPESLDLGTSVSAKCVREDPSARCRFELSFFYFQKVEIQKHKIPPQWKLQNTKDQEQGKRPKTKEIQNVAFRQ